MAASSFSRLSGMMSGDAPAVIPRSTFSVVAGFSESVTSNFVLIYWNQEAGRKMLTNVIRSYRIRASAAWRAGSSEALYITTVVRDIGAKVPQQFFSGEWAEHSSSKLCPKGE